MQNNTVLRGFLVTQFLPLLLECCAVVILKSFLVLFFIQRLYGNSHTVEIERGSLVLIQFVCHVITSIFTHSLWFSWIKVKAHRI